MTDLTERDVESLVEIAHAQLAVCAAAKAERRNALALADVRTTGKAFDQAVEKWSAACRATDGAVDALIELEAAG